MNKDTTESGVKSDNEVIAEFMGHRHRKNYGPLTGEEYVEVKITPNANWQIAHYQTSWDWLMPVVETIRNILQNNTKYSEYEREWELICLALQTAQIEAVKVTVFNFINRYNQISNIYQNKKDS